VTDDLAYATIEALAPRIAAGALSPVELTEAQLARIEALDGRLKSYATVMADSALAEARQAEDEIAAGDYRGPLHGIPIAVKDLCYTAGVRTMGGTKVLEDFLPDVDATVVARFRQVGAILLGKLNLTEGAIAGYNRARPVPVNPWAENRWPGRSSSGWGDPDFGRDSGSPPASPKAASAAAAVRSGFARCPMASAKRRDRSGSRHASRPPVDRGLVRRAVVPPRGLGDDVRHLPLAEPAVQGLDPFLSFAKALPSPFT